MSGAGEAGREPVTARLIAVRVLERVMGDAAFASAALDAELSRARELEGRDRALATELTYGVLRTRVALEECLQRYAPRLDMSDDYLVAQLLVATYQLLVLERVPDHAAVDSAVEMVKNRRGAKVAGFVNAVLRSILRKGEKLELGDAIYASQPEWLRQELVDSVGEESARSLVVPIPGQSLLCLRLRGGEYERETPEWISEAKPGRVSPLARWPGSVGNPRKKPGYKQGDFVIQEEGAQLIALALGARPGEKVLDVCAGRGQKAAILAEQVGATGEVWASDLYPRKLEALEAEFKRLGLKPAQTRSVDFSVGSADLPKDFDRVLVDAPCSGVGTLRRRPEIAGRLAPTDAERLSQLQVQILRRAASLVKPGGRLVYAVCSVLKAESEDVVNAAADVLSPTGFDGPAAVAVAGTASSFRLLPGAHGTDGYFVASFERVAAP